MSTRAAALFVSHGAPTEALADDAYTRALSAYGASRPKPRALVVVSAHWETRAPSRVTAAEHPATIHDFHGFPPPLYALSYPAPGSPDLAREVCERIPGTLPLDDRGLDHGVWTPLRFVFPKADVPVVALSQPVPRTPADILAMGRALRSLRDDGVMLFGSGGVVHNLQRVRFTEKDAPVEGWAGDFDAWVRDLLVARDEAALVDYRQRAPHAGDAVPSSEHFDPLFFTLGGARDDDRLESVYEGFHYGNLSMRCFAFETA